jgi:hypothetical protein
MARHKGLAIVLGMPEEDTSRQGSTQFADPSTARMTRDIHEFNEPHSLKGANGEQCGIRTPFGNQAPWSQQRDAHEAWEHMNRKRGVSDEKA